MDVHIIVLHVCVCVCPCVCVVTCVTEREGVCERACVTEREGESERACVCMGVCTYRRTYKHSIVSHEHLCVRIRRRKAKGGGRVV